MNVSLDPHSFARALDFLLWWQWFAIAAWGWGLIWLLQGHPWALDAFTAGIPSHPVITGMALFATIWASLTFINFRFRLWQSRRADRRHAERE